MRKTITFPLLGIIGFLLFWINLPPLISDRLRELISFPFEKRGFVQKTDELAVLQLENRNLRSQIDQLNAWLQLKEKISEPFLFVPAQVIYRDPSLWSSSLWMGVGEQTNREFGQKIVAKNSPVLADGALVGVVEFVGEKQSRVRLVTDSGLCPSVRVCRGGKQNRELSHSIDSLLKLLEKRDDLQKDPLVKQLELIKNEVGSLWEDGYLAKGEVHGSSSSFWRSRSPTLKGIGFNYDFPDGVHDPKVPILKEGDLLETTGLDGVFPPGIPVGTVIQIKAQQMGSSSYDIEVRPAVTHLNDLHTLFVLPPIEE